MDWNNSAPAAPPAPPTQPSEEYQPFISTIQLARKCPLDGKTNKYFTYSMLDANNVDNPGPLVKIPREVFERILKNLDIKSLSIVRRCSQYCREAVTSILEWQEISQHAPEALRAILSTGIGANILLIRLYHALTNPECEFCHENSEIVDPACGYDPEYLDGEKVLGSFLSLFEGKRACAYCLRNDISLRAINYMDLLHLKSRHDSAIKFRSDMNYPRVRVIPDIYGIKKYRADQRITLVSFGSIEMVPGKRLSANDARVLQGSPDEVIIPKHPFVIRKDWDSQITPQHEYVASESPQEIARRYMTAIPFPFFGKTKTWPNDKKRITFHSCKECFLTERYHGRQFRDSLEQCDSGEMIRSCAANIYKRETRVWLDDIDAEKNHVEKFHQSGPCNHHEWKEYIGVPLFDMEDPNVWEELRCYSYKDSYFTDD
ncbi:hypothetical protein EYC80_000366 [Monilinia laxa]|uniref:F-box domain-containing protein n=1 Tax=Monilinia laxa TaxID=61186 RepID=A0A5N6KAB5_MONLA|nr:hypothetical protein EYC80_000366 [Monilinia laxa]